MADLLSHLLIGYAIAKLFNLDKKVVILGSFLPDVSRMITVFPDVFHILFKINLNYESFFLFGEPFHAPIVAFLLSVVIASFYIDMKKSLAFLNIGILSHLSIDVLQSYVGYGNLLLLPFSYQEFSLGLNWINSIVFTFTIIIISSLIFILTRNKKYENLKLNQKTEFKRIVLAILSIVIVIFIFVYSEGKIIENNIHYVQFYHDPSKWIGKNVSFFISEVIDAKDDYFVIQEFGKNFTIYSDKKVNIGEWVSVEGMYDGDKIIANDVIVNNNYFVKIFSSVIGLIFLIYILFGEKIRKIINSHFSHTT